MMKFKFIAAAAACLIALAGCGTNGEHSGQSQSQATESRGSSEQKQAEPTMNSKEQTQTVKVELDDYYFEPKTITIPQGKTVTLILHNEGTKEHDFIVEKLGIHVDVNPGKTKKVKVTAKKPGTFKLICEYHKKKGMTGKIIVK